MDGLRVFESGRKDGWNGCIGGENILIGGWNDCIGGENDPIGGWNGCFGGENNPIGGWSGGISGKNVGDSENRSGALLFCELFGTDCR